VRVHIISDMEGVAGIVKWEQVSGGEKLYDEGRVLYTRRSTRPCAAKAAGATEIVVMDCHGAGWPVRLQLARPRPPRPAVRVRRAAGVDGVHGFLESGCDAALFVGMHAMAGTADGVLSHTVSGRRGGASLQRDARRRDRHQRGALRPWGVPVSS
jgi:D-aminopeptidase